MKICLVIGTRPEIIKLVSVIKELEKRKVDFFIINTFQHYDKLLNRSFYEEYGLTEPQYTLNETYLSSNEQIGKMILRLDVILKKEKPDVVIVQGDTNSVLAGALAADRLGIKVAHIESGLRSHDARMLEERNRIMVDHIANYLFAPTVFAANTLMGEGLMVKKIYVVGNTIADVVKEEIPTKEPSFGIFLTLHRAENIDDKQWLIKTLNKLGSLKEKIILPIHPRLLKNLKKFETKLPKNINQINPLSHKETLDLIRSCKTVITDSGGLQEESCILHKPCITLRKTTERPETMKLNNSLVSDPSKFKYVERKLKEYIQPYGTDVGKKIVEVILCK